MLNHEGLDSLFSLYEGSLALETPEFAWDAGLGRPWSINFVITMVRSAPRHLPKGQGTSIVFPSVQGMAIHRKPLHRIIG
jgi:hypothetical protein